MKKQEAPKPIPPIVHPEIRDIETDPYHVESPFIFPPKLGQGLFEMPDETYHSIELPSYSFYKAMAQSPAHGLAFLRESKTGVINPIKKKNFDFGSALHLLMLEPELFAQRLVIQPDISKNSNDYKAFKQTLKPEHIVLSSDEIESAMQMRDRAMRKDTIKKLFSSEGVSEVSGIFEDSVYPLWHKIRIDKIVDGIVIDYKTAGSASPWGFQKSIMNYKYYWQAALYLAGVSKITGYKHGKFAWIVQEKEDPWECRIHIAEPSEIIDAEIQLEMQIEKLSECIESSYWPGYVDAGLDDFFMDMDSLEEDDLPL